MTIPSVTQHPTSTELLTNPYKHRKYWLHDIAPGWHQLVIPLLKELEELGGSIVQVKEKFGGLRFYFELHQTEDREQRRAVRAFRLKVANVEDDSTSICEYCGSPGKISNNKLSSWVKTLCEVCKEMTNQELYER